MEGVEGAEFKLGASLKVSIIILLIFLFIMTTNAFTSMQGGGGTTNVTWQGNNWWNVHNNTGFISSKYVNGWAWNNSWGTTHTVDTINNTFFGDGYNKTASQKLIDSITATNNTWPAPYGWNNSWGTTHTGSDGYNQTLPTTLIGIHLLPNETNLLDYRILDTINNTFFGDGYNQTLPATLIGNHELSNGSDFDTVFGNGAGSSTNVSWTANGVTSDQVDTQYNYCIADGDKQINCSSKSFIRMGDSGTDTSLFIGNGDGTDSLRLVFDSSGADGIIEWRQNIDSFRVRDKTWFNNVVGIGTTANSLYPLSVLASSGDSDAIAGLITAKNTQETNASHISATGLSLIATIEPTASTYGSATGILLSARLDSDDNIIYHEDAELRGATFTVDTKGTFSNVIYPNFQSARFRNTISAGETNVTVIDGYGNFIHQFLAGSENSFTNAFGTYYVGLTTTNNNFFGNYSSVYIADHTAGNCTGNCQAITVETQDGVGQDADNYNIFMQGGDWNTGHLVLGTNHIWANTTSIQLKNGVPTANGDYDISISTGGLDVKNNFTGNQIYGELYIDAHNGIQVDTGVQDSYINVTNWNHTADTPAPALNGFALVKTTDAGANSGNNSLMAMVDGTYFINYGISFKGGTGDEVGWDVAVNGAPQIKTHSHRKLGGADVGNTGSTGGLLNLNRGDNVTLVARIEDGAGSVVNIVSANVNLLRVGD